MIKFPPRLSRFKRAPAVAPMQLTERDRNIIRLVYRHRFLRSSHIVSLIGDSPQQILRRLKLLYHHGFLERPRSQINYYHQSGSRHIVYGLGSKSSTFLSQELSAGFRDVPWDERNQSVGGMFLEHALLVSDIMVAIELSCRQRGIRLITEDELLSNSAPQRLFRWNVKVDGNVMLSVVPDRVFALEFPDSDGKNTRRFFCLEADRGTMPVKRAHLCQTSFYRKLLAYQATWRQKVHQRRFGWDRFRLLTVTNSDERIIHMQEAVRSLNSGHGLFLFLDSKNLNETNDVLNLPWKSLRDGEKAFLLD